MAYKDVIKHIKKRKKDLTNVLGGKCIICGFDAFQEALEFHHVNPEEKEFSLSASTKASVALEKQLKEIKKCVLLCSNCHKGVHAGYIEIPEDWKTFYDEKIANELIEQLDRIKHHQVTYCRRCGKIISNGAAHCEECAQFERRTVERPSREELKQLIRTTPFTTIATQFGITDNAIRKWCTAYNLPRTKKDINNYSEEEWEKI